MSLYQKIRPQSLDEIKGNSDLVDSLKGIVKLEHRAHTYLLTGPSGTGKTTIARILAKEFGADDFSIREINSSNNRGIDTAREIANEIQYVPDSGMVVYIIDEVHKTTNEWQNAMLKVLEEPPEYVYFLLCTTEPSKLIAALKNRCVSLVTEGLSINELISLLKKANREEDLKVDPQLLEDIADRAAGSPRLALNILEHLSSASTPEAQAKLLKKWAGTGDESPQTIDICRAIMRMDKWSKLAPMIKEATDEPESIRRAVLGYASAALLGANSDSYDQAEWVLKCFAEPTYNTGKPGLVLAAYKAVKP